MTDGHDDMTMGEVGRRLQAVEADVRATRTDLSEIKTALAGQSVKIGIVWAGIGMGVAALITSGIGTAVTVLAR